MSGTGGDFAPVSASVQLRFLDYRIRVHANSLRLASKLQSYFSDYLDAEPSDRAVRLDAIVGAPHYDASRLEIWRRASSPNRKPKESFYDDVGARYILKNRTGVLIVLRDGGAATITGDLEANANQVVNLIGTLFGLSLARRGYVLLHASAVVETATRQAFAFAGNSGSGKSSLALQLIERGGYDFVSNDRILLKCDADGVQIVGLPKKPRVNPGTLLASAALSRLVSRPRRRAYEQLGADELWQLEEKTDIDVDHHLGARSTISARLARVYSLEWSRNGTGLEQRELDVDGALAAMRTTAKDFGPYELRNEPPDASEEMLRIARTLPFTGVAGRADPHAFVDVLARSNSGVAL